ncbi:low affinity iron permease family protein [Permianibacter sp. IMCC34836]|uniref:low affinity iron permease family protein n=1 Tax=Permianibacter fluminis TaxID=2738515 RepID=UPI00155199DC|nr:low affinity iron permease family protein [Permianibacter fluminis]NQD37147.1 low affinity iron permease family protein [Permianibacter fluminis]
MRKQRWFSRFAKSTARLSGRPLAFNLAVLTIAAWLISGPLFGFSDTWQLVINTATTIITFLMVFLIQNTQNRDTEAIQVKLDELIRATKGAHNALLDLEELEEHELDRFRQRYQLMAEQARAALSAGEADTETPEPSADGG